MPKMLSLSVLKALDRTTKVLVDREETGLGMDMIKRFFSPSCGSGDGVCEPRGEYNEWEHSLERKRAMTDPDNRGSDHSHVRHRQRPRVSSPDPPKRRGILVKDRLFRDEFTPFPTGDPVRTFQVTYNNRYNYGTLFDASINTYCKLDVSEYEQDGKSVFMIRGKDGDLYLSTDNITDEYSWEVREVGRNVIFFDVISSDRQHVDQFRFFKVREFEN
jgi:hypothetical protein